MTELMAVEKRPVKFVMERLVPFNRDEWTDEDREVYECFCRDFTEYTGREQSGVSVEIARVARRHNDGVSMEFLSRWALAAGCEGVDESEIIVYHWVYDLW